VGNIEAVTAAMSNERLLVLPGRMVSYNAIAAFSLLGAIVQRLDERRRPFRQILREDVFEPLGMKDTALGLPERLKSRIVPVKVRDKTPGLFDPLLLESLNFLATEETELPAGGAVSTVLDIFRFSEMLRRGGTLNRVRLLSPDMVKYATTIHTGDLPNHLFDYCREMYGWPVFPANLGLSFFIRGEGIFPTPLGLTTSPATFGGLGAGSTVFWVDPSRDLTYVFLSAGLLEEGHSIMRHQRLSDMVVAAVMD
jgi:CubicO group peptidase (beta-lactamase class C family)